MAAADAKSADYRLDLRAGRFGEALTARQMFGRGAWTLAFALVLFFINRAEYPGPAAQILVVLSLIALAFFAAGWLTVQASKTARFQIRDRILDSLALKGDERVLDVGCGSGLMAIGAAKRLKTGAPPALIKPARPTKPKRTPSGRVSATSCASTPASPPAWSTRTITTTPSSACWRCTTWANPICANRWSAKCSGC